MGEKGVKLMNKKQLAVLSISAICIILLMGIFALSNNYLDYEKTVVVNDKMNAEVLNNTNSDVVQEVKLHELPEAASIFDIHQLQLWYNDKVLLRHINPLFKMDKNMNPIGDMNSPYSYYLNDKTDFSKNALYLMDSINGETDQLIETNPYNDVRCYLSPNRDKMLIFEAYNIIGENKIQNAALKKSNSVPFVVDGYDIKNRVRMYDFKTKQISIVDEWDSKYFPDKTDNEDIHLYNTFGDLSWSMDGKGIVYCEKTATDSYTFKIFNLAEGEKHEYTMQESSERFERVFVHGISKDLKRIWFSGVNGSMKNNLEFDVVGAESAIYLLDLNLKKEAQELVKNMVFAKVLGDENTILYAKEPNASDLTFKLYQYDMSKKQNKLIAENLLNNKFELSRDEKKLIYLSSNHGGFEVNMLEINSDIKPEKTLLYKSAPNLYTANGLSWNNDDSKVAISYYTDNGTLNHSGQICILTLKKK